MMSLPFFVLVYCVLAYALFWIIRLGVRYGMDDALRRNRSWLAGTRSDDGSGMARPEDRA